MIKNNNINILIINDCSTEKNKNSKHQFKNIKSVKVINLKRNVGHDRAIAVGLNILYKKKLFDYVITMDSDGEDNPKYIKSFIEKINEDKNVIIVAKRIKRSENLVFTILYFLHLVILFIFVGKWINFGGYNCLSKLAVKNLLKEKFRFKVEDIADFIINYIGVKGTLIVPTFNFDFCKGEIFSKNSGIASSTIF